jgi:putative transposase
MPQSLAQIYVHFIWSTKNREPHLSDSLLLKDTHAYLGGIAKTLECNPVCIGGIADHVHLLVAMGRTCSAADFAKETKRNSTKWLKEAKGLNAFAWQSGYGAFSVSHSNVEKVIQYITHQAEHHRKVTFQEEYRTFMQKHGLIWDEKYVWD